MTSKGFLGFSIICLIIVVAIFAYILNHQQCIIKHSPSMDILVNGLNKDYKFKNLRLRAMAESIFNYRLKYEYTKPEDEFVSIFSKLNASAEIAKPSNLSDVALYKLATASDSTHFNNLIFYIPIFNHERYVECIKAFDNESKTFRKIDEAKSTSDIIITEIFGIDMTSSTTDEELIHVRNEIQNNGDEVLFLILENGFINGHDRIESIETDRRIKKLHNSILESIKKSKSKIKDMGELDPQTNDRSKIYLYFKSASDYIRIAKQDNNELERIKMSLSANPKKVEFLDIAITTHSKNIDIIDKDFHIAMTTIYDKRITIIDNVVLDCVANIQTLIERLKQIESDRSKVFSISEIFDIKNESVKLIEKAQASIKEMINIRKDRYSDTLSDSVQSLSLKERILQHAKSVQDGVMELKKLTQ